MAFNAAIPYSVGTGITRVMLARQAAFPLWADFVVATGTSHIYGVTHQSNLVPGTNQREDNTPLMADSSAIGFINGTSNTTPNGFSISSASSAPPSGYPVIGVDENTGPQEWIWCPTGASVTFGFNMSGNAPAALSATPTVQQWISPGEYVQGSITASAGLVVSVTTGNQIAFATLSTPHAFEGSWIRIPLVELNETVAYPGPRAPWWSVVIGVSTFTPTVTVTGFGSYSLSGASSATTAFLPIAGPVEYANSTLPWASTRVTAVGALFTNTTKVLNKEGTVLWGRLNPRTVNPFTAGVARLNVLHPAEKAFLPLETGAYTYTPPSTDVGTFLDYRTSGALTVSVPCYRLDNDAFVNVGAFSDPDGGTSLAINLDWHVEFKTNSTLFQIGVSSLQLEALHMAQVTLLKAGFFFNNLDHIALINKILSTMAALHPLTNALAPMARGFARSFAVAAGRKPPAATTARSSGITMPPRKDSTKVRSGTTQRKAMAKALASMQRGKRKGTRRSRARSRTRASVRREMSRTTVRLPRAGFMR